MKKLLKAFATTLSGVTTVECAFMIGLASIAGILAWDALPF